MIKVKSVIDKINRIIEIVDSVQSETCDEPIRSELLHVVEIESTLEKEIGDAFDSAVFGLADQVASQC